jgi:sigma-B regulation protein RsbU (phosphoserine phosphatase)
MNSDSHDTEQLLRNARVLVVDDSRLMRLGLIRALGELGIHNTAEAGNGRQALERIQESAFDLMLLDIEMPEMTGLELLRVMKRDGMLAGLPVIVISSAEQIETAVQCIEAGAEDYLPKSFNPTLLRARATSSLEKKRLRDLEVLRARQLQDEKELLERTQQRLDKELADAAHYVRSIFPTPTREPLLIDWHYQPSTELGGDAFGYHWIDDDHFAVYLLDVCGHGVGACLLSVAAINVIRSGSLSGTDWRDPAAVMKALGNAFLMEKQNNMYFTLWYGVYHRPTRRLRHASGGHPPALLLVPGDDGGRACVRLRSPGLIVGMMEDIDYEAQECAVPEGSQLLVLCDGCFEIRDTNGKDASFEDFESAVLELGTAEDGPARVFDWAHQLHGGATLEDDFSLVRIRF